ncbi:MAG: TlpA family protein disulfide reductase [Candidatus Cloacimonetes bacterium]|nr:TlpA family protein disulfide reductase [Candidatus Cloacimonadota bacterium]
MKATLVVTLAMLFAVTILAAEPIADFSLEDIDGNQVTLSDLLAEGPVLINFWATWCVNCKKEMPRLSELQDAYEGITIICISIDKPGKKAQAIKEVKNRFSFLTLLDPEKTVYESMNATNPPSTYILSAEGEVVWSHEGYRKGDEEKIEEQIKLVLAGGEE